MNASVTALEELEVDYGHTSRTHSNVRRIESNSQRSNYGRVKASGPKKYNGMHRRRRKKIAW